MKDLDVNVFDFDHTIYNGDASMDFIMFCMARRPKLWKYLPLQALGLAHYILGSWGRKRVKQTAFILLRDVPDVDTVLENFWDRHERKIASWYRNTHRASDIVVSASPKFIVEPIARRLGIGIVIATDMDRVTGLITGKNCHGNEKVKRLQLHDPSIAIGRCYSDSLSDMPLLQLAQHPFIVRHGTPIPLSQYSPPKTLALRDPAFLRFLLVGGINAFFGILFSFIISLFIQSPLLAFVIGYALSLVISYFLNAAITFREVTFSMRQFLRFCVSYIPNFIIVSSVVHVLADILRFYPLAAYILAVAIAAPVTFLLLSKFTFTKRASI